MLKHLQFEGAQSFFVKEEREYGSFPFLIPGCKGTAFF